MTNTNNKTEKETKKINSIAKHYVVKKQNLPLSCPTKETASWSLHPRVYLPIEESGEVSCPYCGAKYVLEQSS